MPCLPPLQSILFVLYIMLSRAFLYVSTSLELHTALRAHKINFLRSKSGTLPPPPPPEKYNWPKHSGFSKWLWRATCSKFVFSWTVLFLVCGLSLRLLNVLCGLINCRDCMAELFEILRATILNYGLSLKWCATDLCLVYERWFSSGAIPIGSHPELFPGDFIFNVV